jgi:glutamate-1-semialdehyde aminotransferase
MDAIRLARGVTGRDKIVKIEGSYHGHHESVLVSIRPSRDKMGPREAPASVEFGSGTPRAVTELTLIVPFNDAEDLDRLLTANAGEVAALIMEPVMMNVGIIDPEPGYLDAVREICSATASSSSSTRSRRAPPSPTAAPRRSTGSPPTSSASPRRSAAAPPWAGSAAGAS